MKFFGKPCWGQHQVGPTDYHAKGSLRIPDEGRFQAVRKLAQSIDLGKEIEGSMQATSGAKSSPVLADNCIS